MTTTDAAFLSEVEHFLTSCNLPLITSFEVSNGHERATRETPHTKRQREDLTKLDAASRHELEKAKDRMRRRAYREQRRIERENLLQEINRLAEKLQKTKEEEAKNASMLSTSYWKMVAQRQLAARESAELQQKQLCQAIGIYSTVMKDFERLFNERLCGLNDYRNNEGLLDSVTEFIPHKKIRFETSHAEIFASYIKELDAVYAQTDKTLQGCRLESTEANWQTPSEIWDEDPKTGYVQFRGKITMPFDFQEICRSRWQIVHLLHLQDYQEIYDAVDNPENTLAIRVRRTIRLTSGGIASILRRLVIRRYESDGRMVLVWRMFTEGEGIFTGMHADETGWGVATAVEGSSKTGTVLRTCVHNVPMHFKTAQNQAVKQFGDKLLEWGRENNEEATLGLERLLLRHKLTP